MPKKALALLLASHPGPCAVVTAVAAVLGFGLGYPPGRLILLALAVLAGQLSIGWSNDWIDAKRDAAVHRTDKPVARGTISVAAVRTSAFAAATATIVLSLLLGPLAAIVHLVAVAMAWAYNARLKSTPFSFMPFAVSFGLLPAVATFGQIVPRPASPWVIGVGALLGVAAHFTNVLPDLVEDKATGVRGLPHIFGARTSGLVAFLCLAGAGALLAFGSGRNPPIALWVGFCLGVLIAVIGSALTLRGKVTRFLMQLIMTAAIIDVVMLALAGQSIAT